MAVTRRVGQPAFEDAAVIDIPLFGGYEPKPPTDATANSMRSA